MTVHVPTVGRTLKALSHAFPNDVVFIEVNGIPMVPYGPHSYRGDHEQLAFQMEPGVMTVAEFRILLEGVIGRSFRGWKGNEYVMTEDTLINIAEWGDTGKLLGDRVSEYDRTTGVTTYRFIMSDENEEDFPY